MLTKSDSKTIILWFLRQSIRAYSVFHSFSFPRLRALFAEFLALSTNCNESTQGDLEPNTHYIAGKIGFVVILWWWLLRFNTVYIGKLVKVGMGEKFQSRLCKHKNVVSLFGAESFRTESRAVIYNCSRWELRVWHFENPDFNDCFSKSLLTSKYTSC